MIPSIDVLTQKITEPVYSSRTYKINTDLNRIDGYTNEIESIKQAIYLILSTERYKFIIYSWDYGVELFDLIGKPMPYVIAEVPRRTKEALMQDDRIMDVVDFTFETQRNKLHTTFTVVTNIGDVPIGVEVEI